MAKVIFDNGIVYEGTSKEIVDILTGVDKHIERKEESDIETKWAEIDRKTNEYKVGDIIGYKFSKNDETIAYVIKRIEGDELWFYCDDSKKDMYIRKSSDSIKFVTPVEARFDR
jgi:hypothetical protein